mmetsp:Transcript_56241/g.162948  ORF Transcript_56241/g.162948 Transcript_56241/m.162948 type:complete len:233 (+) Transcript_56241:261-959(+)
MEPACALPPSNGAPAAALWTKSDNRHPMLVGSGAMKARPIVLHGLRRTTPLRRRNEHERRGLRVAPGRQLAHEAREIVRARATMLLAVWRCGNVQESEVVQGCQLMEVGEPRLELEGQGIWPNNIVHVERGPRPAFQWAFRGALNLTVVLGHRILRGVSREPHAPEEQAPEDIHVRVVVHWDRRARPHDENPDRELGARVDTHEADRYRVVMQADSVLRRHPQVVNHNVLEQ